MDAIRLFRILNALICISLLFPAEAQQKAAQSGTFAVYFSPHGGATDAVNDAIENAGRIRTVRSEWANVVIDRNHH